MVSNESEPKSSQVRAASASARPRTSTSRARKPVLADASMIGLGTQIFSEVIAGVLLGLGADYLFDTNGRWVVVGALVGVGVAMWTLLRIALTMKVGPKPLARSAAPDGARPTPNSSSKTPSAESSNDDQR